LGKKNDGCLKKIANFLSGGITLFKKGEIMKRKISYEEIENEQRRFQQYLFGVPVAITARDKDFNIIYANEAYATLVGRGLKDIIGKKCYEVNRTPLCGTDECDLVKVMQTGKNFYGETSVERSDGKKIPVKYGISPLKDKMNRVVGEIVYDVDIAELRKHEQEQANAISAFMKVLGEVAKGDLSARIDTKGWSEEFSVVGENINTLIESLEYSSKEARAKEDYLKTVMASVPEMLYTFDANAITTYINPAFTRFTGFTEKDMIGVPIEKWPALPSDLRSEIAARVRKRVKSGQSAINVACDLVKKSGERFSIRYSASGIRNEEGDVIGEVVLATPITRESKRE
jgi:PAS domain S-box-containing protein